MHVGPATRETEAGAQLSYRILWSKLKQNSRILAQNGEESCPFPRVFFPSPKLNFDLLSSDDDLVKERILFGGFLRGHREKLWVLSVKSFHMQKQYEGTGRNTAEDPWISHGQFTPKPEEGLVEPRCWPTRRNTTLCQWPAIWVRGN